MCNKLNVVRYDASLQKLASLFHSGNDYLDRFLRESPSLDNNIGKTFVFLSDDNNTIIGYYNLGLGYIEQIEGNTVHKIGGAVHINCFALDERYHGIFQAYTDEGVKVNLSDVLLDDCMQKFEQLRDEYVGFSFVTLSSTKEGYSLYERNGFETLEEDMNFSVEASEEECIPMFLAMDIE